MLVTSQRAVAYLLVDGEQTLVNAGGDLEHYGLAGLQHQDPACEQLPFLEGLLPLTETPFLLRSMGMPSGRVADIHLFADEDATWVVLLDVTAEHDEARKIQQKAYDMTLLSQREARLHRKARSRPPGAHARAPRAGRIPRSAAPDAQPAAAGIARCRALRAGDPAGADRRRRSPSTGVSCLPPSSAETRSATTGSMPSTSPSTSWTCAVTASAPPLLSVAVTNTLRSGALLDTDFRLPEAVLGSLNQAYQMEHHNEMYFTIWYGVYHRPTGRLRYATAGHPPPILVNGPSGERGEAQPLPAQGFPWGCCRRPAMCRGMHARRPGPAVPLQRRRLRNQPARRQHAGVRGF